MTEIERKLLTSVAEHLDEPHSSSLNAQIDEMRHYIDRTNNRISVFYQRPRRRTQTMKICPPGPTDVLFKVNAKIGDSVETHNVTIKRGAILTVELKRPRKHYRREILEVVGVRKGKERESYTFEIDAAEHG